jgi:hypothetical protein
MRFRPWVLLSLTIAIAELVSSAPAQNQAAQPAGPPVVSFSDGGASLSGTGPMESIYISPKPGAPFSMKLAAEWSHPLATGGSFTLANERGIARDQQGKDLRGAMDPGAEGWGYQVGDERLSDRRSRAAHLVQLLDAQEGLRVDAV